MSDTDFDNNRIAFSVTVLVMGCFLPSKGV
jgi:hypothetical protein